MRSSADACPAEVSLSKEWSLASSGSSEAQTFITSDLRVEESEFKTEDLPVEFGEASSLSRVSGRIRGVLLKDSWQRSNFQLGKTFLGPNFA